MFAKMTKEGKYLLASIDHVLGVVRHQFELEVLVIVFVVLILFVPFQFQYQQLYGVIPN
jgi:hypothetical protein